MYKVRGADQREYGPIPADVVRDWIRQRRLIASSLVQFESTGEWKPLSAFPEFAGALASPVSPPAIPGAPSSVPPPPRRTSGLAVSSLVLGILGFISCGITALVGLILGIVSLVQIKKGKVVGKGLAITGIVLSTLALLAAPVVLGLLFREAQKGKFGGRNNNNCEYNLKQIGLAARMYALDHGNTFPTNFTSLSNDLMSPKALVCNGDLLKTRAEDWSDVGPRNISYELLVPGRKLDEVSSEPAIRCPIHQLVCLGDGTIRKDRK